MFDKYVKLPASDLAGWVGFGLAVVAVVVIAKRLPVVSGLIK